MKKKHLALILAAAMTVTSVDATALVSAADFSAEETAVQAEEETIAAEETEEVAKDASEEEVQAEAEDGEDLTAETEITEDAEEVTAQEEDSEDADLFSGEEETEAVGADTNVSALTLGETKTVSIAENGSVWLSFTPETDGDYVFVIDNFR